MKARQQYSHALVVRSVHGTAERNTIFGQFMNHLLERHSRESHNVLSGRGNLAGVPVEAIVLSGLWIVMEKIAAKIGLHLSLQSSVQVVAERLNRILGAGMVLVYQDPVRAAMDFEERVLDVVERAMAIGYRSGMTIPVQVWEEFVLGRERAMQQAIRMAKIEKEGSLVQLAQIPAALFFAAIVRAVREYRVRLKKAYEVLDAHNTIENNAEDAGVNRVEEMRVYAYLDTLNTNASVQACLKMLDESCEGDPWVGTHFTTLLQAVETMIEEQNILSMFTVDTKSWPASVGDVVVGEQWLNTQILLAALGASVDEHILPSVASYSEGVMAVQRLEQQVLVGRVLVYLGKKARSKLTARAEEWLREEIIRKIDIIGEWNPAQIDHSMFDEVLVQVADGNWLVDSATALQVAMGTIGNVYERVQASQPDPIAWLEARIVPAIVWDNLSVQEVVSIVRARVLPTASVVDGIRSMSRARIRDQVLKRLVSMPKKDLVLINFLVEHKYLEPTPELVTDHLDGLSKEALEVAFVHLVKMKLEGVKQDSSLEETIWCVFARLTTECAQRMVGNLRWREMFYKLVAEIEDSGDLSWTEFDRVKQTLGDRYYYLLILGVEAKQRAHDFVTWEENEPTDLAPWENMYDDAKAGRRYLPLRAFGPKALPDDAKRILQNISEEEAFRWMEADKRNVNALWKKVAAARDAYFARKKNTGRKSRAQK